MSQTTKNDGTQTGSGTPATDAEMKVALAESLSEGDLQDLCDATVDAINAGGGFGWVSPPPRDTLERYWQGLLLIPDRRVFIARLDGLIAGSVQLHLHPRNNEAQAMIGRITTAFVATWARGGAGAPAGPTRLRPTLSSSASAPHPRPARNPEQRHPHLRKPRLHPMGTSRNTP